jgi:calcium binding protein 39
VYSCPFRYGSKDIALNCGMMLRECLLFDQLAQVFIESDAFFKLFSYIELPTFDIASDAFATFEVRALHHIKILSS